MFDGKPFGWPRVQDFGFGQPIISDFFCLLPCGLISLAASFERTPPDLNHTVSERHERRQVCRHGVIGEETSDHLLKPLPLYQWNRRAIGGQAAAVTVGSASFAAKKRCPKLAPSVPL